MDLHTLCIDLDKVVQARIDSGLRSAEVARKVGISRSRYADYENGRLRLPSNILARLCVLHRKLVTDFTKLDPANHTEKNLSDLSPN